MAKKADIESLEMILRDINGIRDDRITVSDKMILFASYNSAISHSCSIFQDNPKIECLESLRSIPTCLVQVNEQRALQEFLRKFKSVLNDILDCAENTISDENDPMAFSGNIFVVHGHDEEMTQSVARTLESLELKPIILREQANEGRTIIEKFEDYSNVPYAVILISPDDLGYMKAESPAEARPRARQNVILELGFFIAKLGRKNVCPIYRKKNNFELPSDFHGVLYLPYDNNGAWKFRLAKELQSCYPKIDLNKLK